MVSIVTWNGSVIWFPLGYNDTYCDYNRGYRRNRRNNVTIINNNTTVIVNPAPNPNPSPTPPGTTPAEINELRRRNAKTPSLQRVPDSAVMAVSAEEFGKKTRDYRSVTPQIAKEVLAKPIDENQTPPILPEYREVKTKIGKEILVENPRIDKNQETRVKTGVTTCETGKSLDRKLEQERIFGNRQPKVMRDANPANETKTDSSEPRKTGAVNRRPIIRQENTDPYQTPGINPQPTRPTGGGRNDDDRKIEKPAIRQKPREETQTPPIYQPQPKPQPRQEEERRRPQQPRQEQPKPEQPRPQPQPKREEPRQPPKSEPKPEPKQERPAPNVNQRKSDKDS